MPTKRNPTAMRGSRLVINVTIDPDQVAAIDEMADQRRTSRAAIFREALDFFLADHIRHADIDATDSRRAA